MASEHKAGREKVIVMRDGVEYVIEHACHRGLGCAACEINDLKHLIEIMRPAAEVVSQPPQEEISLRGIPQTNFGRGPEFGEEPGNCMQAALATVLGLPLEAVPHFLADRTKWDDPLTGWWDAMNEWLLQHFSIALMGFQAGDWKVPPVWHLMQGRTVRGSAHVVVGFGGKMMFDPHPSGDGLEKVETIEMFVAIDPRRNARTVPASAEGSIPSPTEKAKCKVMTTLTRMDIQCRP